ncbi:MAG: hypothetical protein GX130_11395 [Candidatus Hydrogenedens sp.]|jgi:ABC-type uncharacterized transport system auxiliary subunit|nr:hypothetical protein [Candidatus Hydrogenedens sp.]
MRAKAVLFSSIQLMAGIVLLLSVTGCLSAPVIQKTLHFSLAPEVTVEQSSPLDYTLGIRPLPTTRVYGLPLAYLDHSFQIGYRVREEWAEQPTAVVTRAVQDAIAATGRFKDSGNAADMVRPDLLMTGELRAFHENRTEEAGTVELTVHFQLRHSTVKALLWSDTLTEREPVESSSGLDVARAMNIALERMATRVAQAVCMLEIPPREELIVTP